MINRRTEGRGTQGGKKLRPVGLFPRLRKRNLVIQEEKGRLRQERNKEGNTRVVRGKGKKELGT